MTSTHWAALVYARTYAVDFRTIAVPQDFEPPDLKWAMDYIYGTMKYPEQLREGKPIWSLFKNESYCVVGVTCMARDLVDQSKQEYTKDNVGQGRPLYLFAGYSTRLHQDSQEKLAIPSYLGSNIDEFCDAYKYVIQKWKEKQINEPIRSQYDKDFPLELEPSFEHKITLNNNEDKIRLFPDSEESKQDLWQAAASSLESTSVCWGLQRDRDIISSRFLNLTKPDVSEPYEIDRPQPEPEQSASDSEEMQSGKGEDLDQSRPETSKKGDRCKRNQNFKQPEELTQGVNIKKVVKQGQKILNWLSCEFGGQHDNEQRSKENQTQEHTPFITGLKFTDEKNKDQKNVKPSGDAWSHIYSDSQQQPNDDTDSQIGNDDITDDCTEVNQQDEVK